MGELEGPAHGPARGVGPKVAGPVVGGAADDEDPGERLGGDLEVGVALVVPEADVEPGAVLLDEGVLEDEGVLLGGGDDRLEVGRLPEEEADLGEGRAAK